MKENYYKALIKRIENKLNDTEKELKNTCKELRNTDNILQTNIVTNKNNITKINRKIGEVKVEKVEDVDRIIPLQTQINTINEETIGKDETVGLRKRIKTNEDSIGTNQTSIKALNKAICGNETSLSYSNDNNINTRLTNLETDVGNKTAESETGIFKDIKEINDKIGEVNKNTSGDIVPLQKQINDINNDEIEGSLAKRIKTLEDNKLDEDAIKNIFYKSIVVTASSYLEFEEGHVDARKRLWSLCCSGCEKIICKFEVHRYYNRSIPTLEYNGTIDDLIEKANTYHDANCDCQKFHFGVKSIANDQLTKYTQFIQKNNCVYTFEQGGTYDLYCNICGIHFKSIDHGCDNLLNTGEAILNKFKSNNSDSNKCINNKCNGTFDKDTFKKTITQSIISFHPFSIGKNAYCNFVKHNYCATLLNDLTGTLSTDINRIKTDYIGKKHGDDSTCGARWVCAIYLDSNSKRHYVDVDDCKIIDETV